VTGIEESILPRIGRTPLVRLQRLREPGMADVLVKCEHTNPAGSVKDRTALAMIEAAERAGTLEPGRSVIVEATSGNTGIGLALVAAVKGYRLIVTMPEDMSVERQRLLGTFGAEIHLTPAGAVMGGAVERAMELAARLPGAFMLRQFENPANPAAHEHNTGPEIIAQAAPRSIDAFVAGVGTGGTITGVGRALRARFPQVRIVAVEPAESAVLSGGAPGPHLIWGIGAGFVPPILDRTLLSEVRTVSERDAAHVRLDLGRREGLFVGASSGAAVKVALDLARELGEGRTVVTVAADTGERSLSLPS